jgi:hypothetical protein
MAIELTDKPNTEAPSGAYPLGSIRDTAGPVNGTPVSRLVYSDFHQFFGRMMEQAGIAYNGTPDNASNGYQLNQALQKIIDSKSLKYLYESFGDLVVGFTAISGGFSRWNLVIPNGIYEMDFVNNTDDTFVTTFGMTVSTDIGSISYFKFNQNPEGTKEFKLILNSSNLGGGLPITKKGIAGANTEYVITANRTFLVIRWSDRWELIDFTNSAEWQSVTSVGTDFSAQPAFALLDSDGFVRMKGQSIFEDEPAATNKTVGVLPVGLRPIEDVFFNCICYPSNPTDLVRKGVIQANGNIILQNIDTATLQVNLSELPQFRTY